VRPRLVLWLPSAVMAVGAAFTVVIPTQRSLPLRAPLSSGIPRVIAGYHGEVDTLSSGQRRVARFTDYLMRWYRPSDGATGGPSFSVYVAYYDQQTRGKTIHSPKNCLPGTGWQALASRTADIDTEVGRVTVNRYLLQKDDERALVLYWYQGRGRVEANEYAVKWHLLLDAALRRRSDEALVRVVVPIANDEGPALELAVQAARVLVPALETVLPS
jgi:EpsI family protein